MVLHGALGEVQRGGDFAVAAPRRQVPQHLELARRERHGGWRRAAGGGAGGGAPRGRGRGGGGGAGGGGDNPGGHRRLRGGAAPGGDPDGLGEAVARRVLEQVAD